MVDITVLGEENLMRERTPRSHLEEAFRQELLRLINQYLSFPEHATLGKIAHTLVTYQQARAALEAHSSTLLMGTRSVEICGRRGRGTKPGQSARGKFKNYAALTENGIQ